jgi:hypothetical protein
MVVLQQIVLLSDSMSMEDKNTGWIELTTTPTTSPTTLLDSVVIGHDENSVFLTKSEWIGLSVALVFLAIVQICAFYVCCSSCQVVGNNGNEAAEASTNSWLSWFNTAPMTP